VVEGGREEIPVERSYQALGMRELRQGLASVGAQCGLSIHSSADMRGELIVLDLGVRITRTRPAVGDALCARV
jgi:hypothetical protein